MNPHLIPFLRRVATVVVALSTALALAGVLGLACGTFVRGCNAALTLGRPAR